MIHTSRVEHFIELMVCLAIYRTNHGVKTLLLAVLWFGAITAQAVTPAAMGMTTIGGADDGTGLTTIFYPTSSTPTEVKRGPFTMQLAIDGKAIPGNHRLVVFSHGSGGSPWPMTDLALRFVTAGYAVAMPEHRGDNYRDHHLQGPASWKLRPLETSQTIDAVQSDSRFKPFIDFDHVGVYGTSAGGLTALVLAGGQWSPANFQRYCLAHMAEDFPACVGLMTRLKGNWGDAFKLLVVGWAYRFWFDDETMFAHVDARIKAVLASVPVAAPFDVATLAQPKIAVGLVAAGRDQWLKPRAHVLALLAACAQCKLVLNLPQAGHGSLMSPWPNALASSLTPLLVDPPEFDRADLPEHYQKTVDFFTASLGLQQGKAWRRSPLTLQHRPTRQRLNNCATARRCSSATGSR